MSDMQVLSQAKLDALPREYRRDPQAELQETTICCAILQEVADAVNRLMREHYFTHHFTDTSDADIPAQSVVDVTMRWLDRDSTLDQTYVFELGLHVQGPRRSGCRVAGRGAAQHVTGPRQVKVCARISRNLGAG